MSCVWCRWQRLYFTISVSLTQTHTHYNMLVFDSCTVRCHTSSYTSLTVCTLHTHHTPACHLFISGWCGCRREQGFTSFGKSSSLISLVFSATFIYYSTLSLLGPIFCFVSLFICLFFIPKKALYTLLLFNPSLFSINLFPCLLTIPPLDFMSFFLPLPFSFSILFFCSDHL